MRLLLCTTLALAVAPCAAVIAQQPVGVSRAVAIGAALGRGPRLAIASSDTLTAAAQLLTARALTNPSLSASYTKSLPNYHVTADLPLDFVWLRALRIRSAEAARSAARYRFVLDSATIALDADTIYTRAVAAAARMQLSARTAVASDSIRRIAIARLDAGDASQLDVELATISAGQAANVAAADSVLFRTTMLSLRTITGLAEDAVLSESIDSLAVLDTTAIPVADSTLSVLSASAALQSAALTARVQRRSVIGFPGVTFGFETGDPTGAEPGLLPTVGVSIPLPLFNHNQGPIAEADAARQRAAATLQFTALSVHADIARLRGARDAALTRLTRDRELVASANRVSQMSLVAYREGASPLTSVLEAQRTAREIISQYVDDLATAAIAAASLRVMALGSNPMKSP